MKTFKKYITKFLLIAIFATLITSCIEEAEVILQGELDEKLVVDIKLTTDTLHHKAFLTKTAEYYVEEQTPRVSGANIKIISSNGDIFHFEEIDNGVYQTKEKVYGLLGEQYFLEIEYGNDIYEAESEIRRNATIDSIGFRWDIFMESYRVLLYGQEPEGRGDHYAWHLFKNGVHVTDSLHNFVFTNDEYIDGQYLDGYEIDRWFNNFDFQQGDTITVEMHSITKDTYEFFLEVMLESGGFVPMSGSGKTPVGNISNNAFGLFYTSSIVRATAIIEENKKK